LSAPSCHPRAEWSCNPTRSHYLLWRETHNPALPVGRLHSPQINEGIISPLPSGCGAECWTDPACVVVEWTSRNLVKTRNSTTLEKVVVSWNWQTSKRKAVDQKAPF
jgi:hypothetical protein